MDPQQIKALIDVMASSDLAEMEFSQDGWTLRLARWPAAAGPPASFPPRVAAVPRRDADAARAVAAPVDATVASALCAPLYGVVHLRPAPGEPLFVVAGQAVAAGQTLCVIEAMKVFNEVRAERDAVVDAILVSSGQEVEAGQALLRLV